FMSFTSFWILGSLHHSSDASFLCSLAGWSQAQLHKALITDCGTLSAVDITLDPKTAYPYLILSENLKQVEVGDEEKELPNNPERFNRCACVLGQENFTSGRHCWEVKVGDKMGWHLGVCRENVKRKGWIFSPKNGFWVVEGFRSRYWALTSPQTPLSLNVFPRRVGVYLDYEAGNISFYSRTDGSHIYTFAHTTFSGTLWPFLSLWFSDPTPLTICPVPGEAERNPVPVHAPSKETPGEESASASGDEDPFPMATNLLLSPQPWGPSCSAPVL
uniref:B30.2/SPRY domain-containing protein n=1 Tax=Ornithorhynchus anatinus TaxID=9258 RepID=A0A6I8NTH2_ORNAN